MALEYLNFLYHPPKLPGQNLTLPSSQAKPSTAKQTAEGGQTPGDQGTGGAEHHESSGHRQLLFLSFLSGRRMMRVTKRMGKSTRVGGAWMGLGDPFLERPAAPAGLELTGRMFLSPTVLT